VDDVAFVLEDRRQRGDGVLLVVGDQNAEAPAFFRR